MVNKHNLEKLPPSLSPGEFSYPTHNSSAGKEATHNEGDPSSIPGSERSPGERIGYPLQYSWASLVAQTVKNPPAKGRPGFDPWIGKIP